MWYMDLEIAVVIVIDEAGNTLVFCENIGGKKRCSFNLRL
jgi:hypothetical protein